MCAAICSVKLGASVKLPHKLYIDFNLCILGIFVYKILRSHCVTLYYLTSRYYLAFVYRRQTIKNVCTVASTFYILFMYETHPAGHC